jgi:hypothetical protein
MFRDSLGEGPTSRPVPQRKKRVHRHHRRVVAIVVLATLATAFAVQARPRYVRSAAAKYPEITGTKLGDCRLCHTDKPGELNPYGHALKDSSLSFEAIEKLDSDKDGAKNIVEIKALTFPGDSTDAPPVKGKAAADSTKSKSKSKKSPPPDSTKTHTKDAEPPKTSTPADTTK